MTEKHAAFIELLRALHFAAQKHRDQRRKDPEASPYVNHVIDVTETLVRVGVVDDVSMLQAAILHDTIEDTETSAAEIERVFGAEVRGLVMEMTDDKSRPKEERKRLQIEHAPHLSEWAKQIKLADKICNIRDVIHSPPENWSLERRLEYLDWSEQVVAGCRGCNRDLEQCYDRTLAEGRRLLTTYA